MDYISKLNNSEMEETLERIKNTEWFLDKEYTVDEFEDEGILEVIEEYMKAKEKAESYGNTIKTELEYYPYITGVKCLEITFIVEEED